MLMMHVSKFLNRIHGENKLSYMQKVADQAVQNCDMLELNLLIQP